MGEVSSSSDQAVYIRDILPQNLKDLFAEPNFDIDKALLYQIKAVSKSKKDLVSKRTLLIQAIGNEFVQSNYERCGPFTKHFLTSIYEDVRKDETEARRKVLGEQESVEMFKEALASNSVSEDYLCAARAYRDNLTCQLREVVESREILLIAIEILDRIPASRNCSSTAQVESLKSSYIEAKERHLSYLDVLKKLTEWKKNPNMFITDDDEFFAFFNDANSEEPDVIKEEEEEVDDHVDGAGSKSPNLNKITKDARKKYVHFKHTKVDSIDSEFEMIAELAYDILKHEATINEITIFFQNEVKGRPKSTSGQAGIGQYVNYLRSKHPKLKIKVALKGYNFSLKAMRKTKSVMSLNLLSTLLETSHEMPEEIVKAQEKFSELSNAVKRICSVYGRCSMSFQTLMNKEEDLNQMMRDAPKLEYAASLRVSGHLEFNIGEMKRVNEAKEKVKKAADTILQEVMQIASENKLKEKRV